MTGFYPDVPGVRFALDLDGSRVFTKNVTAGSAWTEDTSAIANLMNPDTTNIGVSAPGNNIMELGVLFPEPRDLRGMFWQGADTTGTASVASAYVSADTSDLTNGTWSAALSPDGRRDAINSPVPAYRSSIASVNHNGARGLRFRITNPSGAARTMAWYLIHLYGYRALTGDRLAIWDPTVDQPLAATALDFGDVAQAVVKPSRQFRVKNLSATLTANTVTVDVADLLGTAFGTDGIQVSTDNVTWGTTASVGNLAPGAISPVRYVLVRASAALPVQARAGRLRASAASWAVL